MSVEVMKQALEALEYFDGEYDVKDEITALRAAIAEASMQRLTDVQQEMEQQPVAWRYQNSLTDTEYLVWNKGTGGRNWTPLYTHPPRREAQQEQEPVAWMVYTQDGKSVCVTDNPADFTDVHRALPLYTTPPAREPLTEDEIERLIQTYSGYCQDDFVSVARAVERTHGIGGSDE